MKKSKNIMVSSIVATAILTTSMTTNIFANDLSKSNSYVQENILIQQEQLEDSEENLNARGIGGAISGVIVGAATGTLTGVVGDIISGNDITIGSITVDFIKGGITGGIQGSKLPF